MQSILDGVRIQPLKLLPNEHGRLMEVQRSDDAVFLGFGQVYVTQSYQGVVKAWYRHRVQIDQLAVVTGLVKLVLFDARDASATAGKVEEIIMGDLAPKLVQIPPGIWHGFKAIGPTDAFLLHLNSVAYNFEQPDEDRLPLTDPSIPYRW
jgi:dTDP-4-dehydrorhamnose 3,5-epimerase